jgi:two-component system sensor histidine kinase CiaH
MKTFSRARLKLTAYFAAIITFLSLLFSLVIYRLQSAELVRFQRLQNERFEAHLNFPSPEFRPPPYVSEDLLQEAQQRLLLRIGITDGVIIVFSAGLGYFLAGRTLAPIQEMVEEQERFFSDASHELKTPLTSLRTSLEVFLRDKKPNLKNATSLIEDNLSEVKRLQNLSESLLDVSSPTTPTFAPFELKESLLATVERLSPLIAAKNIKLKTKLSAGQIKGDKEQITKLFTIILDNAIKYAPDKNGKINLTISLSGKQLIAKIKDNGIGISQADLPHIFDRFYRADSARARSDQGGYGLGLAIAKQLADANNTNISVVSAPKKGSTFTITFPLYS